jgi:hypothetical protein
LRRTDGGGRIRNILLLVRGRLILLSLRPTHCDC